MNTLTKKKKKKLLKISIMMAQNTSKSLKAHIQKKKIKSNYKTAGYKITVKWSGYENPIIALGGCS
jgi:hypothetical protein